MDVDVEFGRDNDGRTTTIVHHYNRNIRTRRLPQRFHRFKTFQSIIYAGNYGGDFHGSGAILKNQAKNGSATLEMPGKWMMLGLDPFFSTTGASSVLFEKSKSTMSE